MARNALLNYSTNIEASKTVSEIQEILGKHGAKAILINYKNEVIDSLSFQISTPSGDVGFRLPVETEAILRVLRHQRDKGLLRHTITVNHAQSVRVAWRILKDWVEAQMAILETEMVKMEQVFLPYMITKGDKTLYEVMVEHRLQLPEGKDDSRG